MTDLRFAYNGAKTIITGGVGFLGSNLAVSLADLGADVTVGDIDTNAAAAVIGTDMGVRFKQADITDAGAMNELVRGADFVFDMAGLSGVVDSNEQPLKHLMVNCGGHLNVLEACRKSGADTKVFFPSSQLVYGLIEKIPVPETHPTEPRCVYGIHKLALEHHYRLYHELYALKASVLRISNPYGPRQSGEHSYGIVNNFCMRALKGEPVQVFAGGTNIRDYVYIDDVIKAILLTAATDGAYGQVMNCGGKEQCTLMQMAESVVRHAGAGTIEDIPWPERFAKTDIGSVFLDKTKIKSITGWEPKTALDEGIAATVAYYRERIKR